MPEDTPATLFCFRCGAPNLHWAIMYAPGEIGGRGTNVRLNADGTEHRCPPPYEPDLGDMNRAAPVQAPET